MVNPVPRAQRRVLERVPGVSLQNLPLFSKTVIIPVHLGGPQRLEARHTGILPHSREFPLQLIGVGPL